MLKKPATLFIKIFLFLFFSISQIFAETVNKIEISGNKRIANETIKMFTKVAVGDELNENEINIILKNLYDTNFFKDVSIDLSKNILVIKVEENPLIESISYDGVKSKSLSEKITRDLKLKERSSYNEILLKEDRNKIISSLKEVGYYFSEVDVTVIELKDNKIDLKFDIILGDKAKIKKISFIGNKIF